jgi:hypothetical protein
MPPRDYSATAGSLSVLPRPSPSSVLVDRAASRRVGLECHPPNRSGPRRPTNDCYVPFAGRPAQHVSGDGNLSTTAYRVSTTLCSSAASHDSLPRTAQAGS